MTQKCGKINLTRFSPRGEGKYSSAVKVTRSAGPFCTVSSVDDLVVRMALPALQVCHDLIKIVVMSLNVGIA